jgi:hypothetical protein
MALTSTLHHAEGKTKKTKKEGGVRNKKTEDSRPKEEYKRRPNWI